MTQAFKTLLPGTPGIPSHILVTDDFNTCERLSETTTAIVVVPEWSPRMRAIFTALESGNVRAVGGPLLAGANLKDEAKVAPAAIAHAHNAFGGVAAYMGLSDRQRRDVDNEFAFMHRVFAINAKQSIEGEAGTSLSLSTEPYPQHMLHSVYAHDGNKGVMAVPQHMVLLDQDGLDTKALATKGRFYSTMESFIQLHKVADAPERLWRVPTGAFVVLSKNQYLGHDWQGQPAPRYASATMGGAIKSPLYIPSHNV